MATEWDKFIALPEWSLAPGRARRIAAGVERPDLIVILEVMLDVKDIAQLDPEEVIQLWNALGQVDRRRRSRPGRRRNLRQFGRGGRVCFAGRPRATWRFDQLVG